MSVNEWSQGDSQTLTEKKIQEPDLYKVFLHNDDYTTMDFVVGILQGIFHKNVDEATAIMLHIHEQGIGLCGTFTREVAETKVKRVHHEARSAGFPLKCTMEKI